ncbi:hypothetical protein M514_24288 [Trichuris suis]|uniref:Uncharacterized protein n=1 Tax=Trichuris suis TaxID=68888 RepID=A0A085N279_9BILA|nr:hypothetical protein M514_24288 [Trichuris suis]
MAATMTLGRRRKQRHGSARSRDVSTSIAVRSNSDDVQWQQLTTGSVAVGTIAAVQSQPNTPPPSSSVTTTTSSGGSGGSQPNYYYTHSLIARQPLSLQCLKYDSGFGSTFSSSVNSSIAAGSTSSSNALPLVTLPPPPPYRRVSLPSTRPLRIHRSYSDSKHRSCRRLDNFHCVSPWCSWSTATSRVMDGYLPSPKQIRACSPRYA